MIRYSMFIAAVLASGTSNAADITVPSHIDAVTVFPDQAQVTRAVKATFGEGDQTLVLDDLPFNIDPNSVRIEAAGSIGIQIGSVDLHAVSPPPAVPLLTSDAERQIFDLNGERAGLDDTIAAAEGKRKLIERLGFAATDGFLKGIGEGKTTADQMKDAWSAFGDGISETLATIRTAHTRQSAIDGEIARIKAATAHIPDPQRPHQEARVAFAAASDGEATFKLTYRIAGAGWQPVYDARLLVDVVGSKPNIELVTRALVHQQTGEDWKDADLTLSTARPSLGTAAPNLETSVVRLWQPQQPLAAKSAPAALAAAPSRAQGETFRFTSGADESNTPQKAEEQTAQIETGGFTTVFHIPGRVTVQTGAGARNFKIGAAKFEAQLSVKATPKQVAAAFLTASFKLPDDAPLLPGKVSIYRAAEFVGSSEIPFIAAGDQIKLGFGEDDKIKVDRIALKQNAGDTGIFSSVHQETHDFKIKVKNLHTDVMPVTIEDQLPVSEANEITIVKLSTTTPPTKANADDRRGVLAWSFDLKPNEEKEIRVGWQLKYPADRDIMTTSTPR